MTIGSINSVYDFIIFLDLIHPEIKHILKISKIIIFYDEINDDQYITDALHTHISSELSAVRNSHEIIQIFFDSIDEKRKKETLFDLESEKYRIIIYTDTFKLDVDISNIDRVIQ